MPFSFAPCPSRVQVSPSPMSMQAGGSGLLFAEGLNDQSQLIDGACSNATWSSSNQSIVAVNSVGEVNALGAGSATVSAICSGVSGSAIVDVAESCDDPMTIEVETTCDDDGGGSSSEEWRSEGGSGEEEVELITYHCTWLDHFWRANSSQPWTFIKRTNKTCTRID